MGGQARRSRGRGQATLTQGQERSQKTDEPCMDESCMARRYTRTPAIELCARGRGQDNQVRSECMHARPYCARVPRGIKYGLLIKHRPGDPTWRAGGHLSSRGGWPTCWSVVGSSINRSWRALTISIPLGPSMVVCRLCALPSRGNTSALPARDRGIGRGRPQRSTSDRVSPTAGADGGRRPAGSRSGLKEKKAAPRSARES